METRTNGTVDGFERNAARTSGLKRKLAAGIVTLAAAASLVAPGGSASADGLSLTSKQTQLPPGWCYSDAIGTYECKFTIRFPFPLP
jgi:hypothetical protein